MKKVILRLLVVICVVLSFSSSVWAEKPIRVLALYPISGPVKSTAEFWLLGMNFAVEEINAQGGLMGRKVELIVEDSQLKPDVAVAKAQKYLLENKADIIVSTVSTVVKSLSQLTKQHNILFAMFSGADEETGKNFTYNSVRLYWNTSMMARALAVYMAKHTSYRKIYLLNQDYSYGRDFAEAAKKEIVRQIPGAQIIGEDYHPFASKDLSPFLTKIKMSGADAILTIDWGLDISVLLKQRHELGVKAVVIGAAAADPQVVRENPEGALGSVTCNTYFNTVNTKENVEFVKRWQKRYKGTEYSEPDSLSSREYIGMTFLFQGIKRAGSFEVNKLMPVIEGMYQKSVNGDIYLRACDHQINYPLPVVIINSKTPPYYGVPVMIPATTIEVPEAEIDNPRCRKK